MRGYKTEYQTFEFWFPFLGSFGDVTFEAYAKVSVKGYVKAGEFHVEECIEVLDSRVEPKSMAEREQERKQRLNAAPYEAMRL